MDIKSLNFDPYAWAQPKTIADLRALIKEARAELANITRIWLEAAAKCERDIEAEKANA